MAEEKQDIYSRVTDKIIAQMERAEASNYEKPWLCIGGDAARPRNATTGAFYRGGNILSLWASAEVAGYQSGLWATYHQFQEAGAQVRKGEKSSPILFYKTIEQERDEAAEEITGTRRIGFARAYSLFNVAQVDGFKIPDPPVLPPLPERIEAAEEFVRNTKAVIERGGNRACYIPALDKIQLPLPEQFRDAEAEFSVAAHELGHWAGAKHRLDRDLSGRFGDDKYAAEEVIVETSSAFTCARLGISIEPRPDHAAYLKHWLGVMRKDSRAIFAAAAQAQRATDYLFSLQPTRPQDSQNIAHSEPALR